MRPSWYSLCAIPIVFRGWKPRLLLAEVCRLVVLKGFGGFPVLDDSFISEIFPEASLS